MNETAQPQLIIYRASHESITLGYYTTREAAHDHCEAYARNEDPSRDLRWTRDDVDDDLSPEELHLSKVPGSVGLRAGGPTGYLVTPLPVETDYDEEEDE